MAVQGKASTKLVGAQGRPAVAVTLHLRGATFAVEDALHSWEGERFKVGALSLLSILAGIALSFV